MDIDIDHAAKERLKGYLDMIGDVLGTPQRQANFAVCAWSGR